MEVPSTDPVIQEGAGVVIHAFSDWAANRKSRELSAAQIVGVFGMAQYIAILTHAVNTESGRKLLRAITEMESD